MWIHFYERFKQNSVCRKFLAETGVRPNYSSRVKNAKIKPFHFLKQSCLFNNLCWGVSICWHSCSANGSWRGWSLICEDFTRSLEELGALGSTEEAGARGLVKSWRLWFLSLGLKIHKGRVGWAIYGVLPSGSGSEKVYFSLWNEFSSLRKLDFPIDKKCWISALFSYILLQW